MLGSVVPVHPQPQISNKYNVLLTSPWARSTAASATSALPGIASVDLNPARQYSLLMRYVISASLEDKYKLNSGALSLSRTSFHTLGDLRRSAGDCTV
jgi:hypothetical protein